MKHTDGAELPPEQPSDMRPVQRILVVDDEPDGAEMVAEMLSGLGFQTAFAVNGGSALATAMAFAPHVILLDLELPDTDGYEVARQLRLEASLAAVVLVAMTGYAGHEREAQARQAGFDHYIVKPIQLAALKQVLGK